jgi:MFS family permease
MQAPVSEIPESPRRWRALVLIGGAELLAMSLWFSGSAVAPALRSEWGLSESGGAWLTLSVQLGFVAGTLVSALGNLPDVFSSRRLFAVSALLGALANAGVAVARGPALGLALRFATGFFLAGVYPPGMKIMASWFRRGRGLALGILVGGISLGKGFPYLVNAVGSASWRVNVLAVSVLAVVGGALVLAFVEDGPFAAPAARFDVAQVAKVFRNRGVRLADFGYFGHMWELYAMWTWFPVFARESFAARGLARPALAEMIAFLVIGAGFVGCVLAGLAADRIGRTAVTSAAMAVSGACCLLIGLLFGGSPWLLLAVAVVWGASIVADSAQFSACVTELSDPPYVGTALTVQTCVGFLLTMASIELVPRLVSAVGWRWAFVALAPGPFLGILAMQRLRRLPEAAQIAHGRR